MTFLANIGALIAIPFIALAAWLGIATHVGEGTMATSTPIIIATSTQPAPSSGETSTSTGSNPPSAVSPAHPIAPQGGAVELDSVSQTTNLTQGTMATLTGSGFTADNTVLLDGMVAARDVHLSSFTNGHQTIEFAIPSGIGPDCKANEACPMYLRLLTSGTYDLSVENENGTSNSVAVTVVGAASI
jgi:hypothetical protein